MAIVNTLNFIGREKQINKLTEFVKGPRTVHMSLYGMPHVGKSSLLTAWINRMAQNNYECGEYSLMLIDEDASGYNNISGRAYYSMMYDATSKIMDILTEETEIEDESLQNELDILVDEFYDYDEIEGDQSAITNLLKKYMEYVAKLGKRTVLIIDEFAKISDVESRWSEEEYMLFSKLLLDDGLDWKCIVTSRSHISYILEQYVRRISPFDTLLLSPFDDNEMEEYFAALYRESGNNYLDDSRKSELQEILYACNRHPFLLSIMAREIIKTPERTPRQIYRMKRDTDFVIEFEDVCNFLLREEADKHKSFTHIVKCYFNNPKDYQDIMDNYVELGYVEKYPYISKFAYTMDVVNFIYPYEDEPEYYYGTISPAFISYLFLNYLVVIKDTRDILTGFIYAIRDITKHEMTKIFGDDWNKQLLLRLQGGSKSNYRNAQYAVQKNLNGILVWENCNYSGLNSNNTNVVNRKAQIDTFSTSNELINITSTSIRFVTDEMNLGINTVMPVLDPINLNDIGKIITHSKYYNDYFKKYFGVLGGMSNHAACAFILDCLGNVGVIGKARNELSHYSRYGINEQQLENSRNYCMYLLESIYTQIDRGNSHPEISIQDFIANKIQHKLELNARF